MAFKIRIKRKRKPWLFHKTKKNFAIGRLCLDLLRPWARLEADRSRAAYEIARTARTVQDVTLKEARESYVIEQARRTELLNVKTRLELENAFGAEKVARALGEPVKQADIFRPANYKD